jgi:beta-glucosidase
MGDLDGAEVAQLYVTLLQEAQQRARALYGFEKVSIKPGESAPTTFSLRRRDLSYHDVAAERWAVANGGYSFLAGSSSKDIRGSAKLTV